MSLSWSDSWSQVGESTAQRRDVVVTAMEANQTIVHFYSHRYREGTGTWPKYLVNRDGKKNEGPFGEKNCTEIEK